MFWRTKFKIGQPVWLRYANSFGQFLYYVSAFSTRNNVYVKRVGAKKNDAEWLVEKEFVKPASMEEITAYVLES